MGFLRLNRRVYVLKGEVIERMIYWSRVMLRVDEEEVVVEDGKLLWEIKYPFWEGRKWLCGKSECPKFLASTLLRAEQILGRLSTTKSGHRT